MSGLLLSLLLFLGPGERAAGLGNAYATRKGDTLWVGNALVERVFLWNGGHLQTLALTDKSSGKTFRCTSPKPDFMPVKDALRGEDGVLDTGRVAQTPSHDAFFKVTVSYRLGALEVRREMRLYDGVPAIASDLFLRGRLEGEPDDILDRTSFPGRHWHVRTVEFFDVTDRNNNLVFHRDMLPFGVPKTLPGNLLFAYDFPSEGGWYFLKEAPCTDMQVAYPGYDFTVRDGGVEVHGIGLAPEDVEADAWTPVYGCVTGVFPGGELSALRSLRAYQKTVRRHLADRDEMVMMNTWGDRSQDSRVNEQFCIDELVRGAALGISHFQVDDGWQSGKSPASKYHKGSFSDIWKKEGYWSVDPQKYPHGLGPVVEKGRELGIEVGLWFNPSIQDELTDWEKDADVLISLYRRYGIRYFKIDGLKVPTKRAERRLAALFEKIRTETADSVVINLDVTAGRRAGYFFMGGYGNIFLENRYTDFGSYYPYMTLRNLWHLSRYVPPERLQIEFLNPWRNADKYPCGDIFAPSNYDFSYLFALTMAGQPLAWFEASNLPEEAFSVAPLVTGYRSIMAAFHAGDILPVGEEPDGVAWTGFQSITDDRHGFLLIYREYSEGETGLLRTWLPDGARVRLTPVLGAGKKSSCRISEGGGLPVRLSRKNSFALYQYEVLPER